jgi:hypothetical protein
VIKNRIKKHIISLELPSLEDTAWFIHVLTPQDSSEIQDHLINHMGFEWGGHRDMPNYRIEYNHHNPRQISSIFQYDIRTKSLTYSADFNLDRTIDIVTRYSSKNILYEYVWGGVEMMLINTYDIER